MKTLQELLKAHAQKLNELTSPLCSDTTTPEVREILIETCKSAIEQLRRDIEDDENEFRMKGISRNSF
jgi:spore coat protein CotF